MTDRTAEFRTAVKSYRRSHGMAAAASEVMAPVRQLSAFTLGSSALRQALRAFVMVPPAVEDLSSSMVFVQKAGEQVDNLKAKVKEAEGMEAAHRAGVVLALCEELRVAGAMVEEHKEVRRWQAKLAVNRLVQQSAKVPKAGAGAGSALAAPVVSDADLFDDGLVDEEDMKAMEMENATLAKELEEELDEVRAVEGQVAEISKLMSVFSDKIMEQHTEVEAILEQVVASRTEVVKGNDQIAQATQRSAGFRFFVLCFLIGASLALLFLDWYGA